MFFSRCKTTRSPSVSHGSPQTTQISAEGPSREAPGRLLFRRPAACDPLIPGDLSLCWRSGPLSGRSRALRGAGLRGWSRVVVGINGPAQSPAATYTWPPRSRRHALHTTESTTQWDAWLEVRTPQGLLFSLKIFYYCLSTEITPSGFDFDCMFLVGSKNDIKSRRVQFMIPGCLSLCSSLCPDVWLWCSSTAGAKRRLPRHLPLRQLCVRCRRNFGRRRERTDLRWGGVTSRP